MRSVVVGGGLSGLTAAYYLRRQRPDDEVILLEADDHLGGVIQTEHRDGWLVEHGADCFTVNPPAALQLCRDLGLEDELIEPLERGRRAMISRGNRLHPVPEGFVLMRPTKLGQVFRSPLMSWAGKLRLAWERFVPARRETGDESLASFVTRRLGREALTRLVQPLVAGIYTADANRLSMQATMPQFVRMEQEHGSLIGATLSGEQQDLQRASSGARYGQFRVFPEGMGKLFDRLAAEIGAGQVRFGQRVTGMRRQSNGWELSIEGQDALRCDGVILALPTHVASRLVAGTDGSLADRLDAFEYASSAIVLLAVRDDQVARKPDAFGFVIPEVERRRILAASFASHKFPGRAPDGHTLIRVFIGGALQPELLEHSDEELTTIAREELAELIGLQGEPVWTAVQRWDRAMPQYHVGHRERVAEVEESLAELPGLEVAGNGLHGVGVAFVVATAKRASERLVQHLEKANV